MFNNNQTFMDILGDEFKKRNNPNDLKPSIIGRVVKLEPLTVSILDGYILLEENEDLEISEWFRFRCNIDKTGVLSLAVPTETDSAESVEETHSYSKLPCGMPSAISSLALAILGVRDELLNLKCNLSIDDYVVVASLTESGKYILLDKVL